MKLTAKLVREILFYNERLGCLYIKQPLNKHGIVGAQAGTLHRNGYRYVTLYGIRYKEHRLIWFIKTGRWPKKDVDHINGKRADNRWSNLRSATRSQNCANARLKKLNTSGFKGISWDRRRKKWRARIKVEYQEKWLGYYDKPEQAHAVYVAAAKKHFGGFARAA